MTGLGGFYSSLLRFERPQGNGWKKRKEKKGKLEFARCQRPLSITTDTLVYKSFI
jgi:hypothetical protein